MAEEPQEPQPMELEAQAYEKLWDKMSFDYEHATKIVRSTDAFKQVYDKMFTNVQVFLKPLDQLKDNKVLNRYISNFSKKQEIWDWIDNLVSNESTQKWNHFEQKTMFGMQVHHLFVFGYQILSNKLVLAVYYVLNSSTFATVRGLSAICQCIIGGIYTSSTISGLVATGLTPEQWSLFFTAMTGMFGMWEIKSVSAWLDARNKGGELEDETTNLVVSVLLEIIIKYLVSNYDVLHFSEELTRSMRVFLIGKKSYKRLYPKDAHNVKSFEDDEEPLLKSPSKRKADDGAGDQSAGAGAAIKKSKSNEDLTHEK